MKSYRIKYKIEVGEWNPITSESDKKPLPGVRILSSGDADVGLAGVVTLVVGAIVGAIAGALHVASAEGCEQEGDAE